MATARIIFLTIAAMFAFAGNSILCRLALKHTSIDAVSFTSIRLLSGAAILALLVYVPGVKSKDEGNWFSAFALFVYAACFSFAYVGLGTASGALLLFVAVQATMIGYGAWHGERFSKQQLAGLLLAFAGLIGFFLPGLSTPPLMASLLMLGAGVAWGIYSLRGRQVSDAKFATAGNFLRTVPITVVFSLLMFKSISLDNPGILYALGSGALASGMGYIIWYSVLPALTASSAGIVQLSVPVIAAVGGIIFLDENLTLHLVLTSIAILGGIILLIVGKKMNPSRN